MNSCGCIDIKPAVPRRECPLANRSPARGVRVRGLLAGRSAAAVCTSGCRRCRRHEGARARRTLRRRIPRSVRTTADPSRRRGIRDLFRTGRTESVRLPRRSRSTGSRDEGAGSRGVDSHRSEAPRWRHQDSGWRSKPRWPRRAIARSSTDPALLSQAPKSPTPKGSSGRRGSGSPTRGPVFRPPTPVYSNPVIVVPTPSTI